MRFNISIILILTAVIIASCKKSENLPEEKKEVISSNPNVDVYVAGWLNNYAAYWKNNEVHQVNNTDKGSSASAIAVQGADVYLSGYVLNTSGEIIITYWKNGVPVYLKNLGNSTMNATTGIAVRGNDVYVAGRTERYNGSVQGISATVWKNGVATYFDNDVDTDANAISITSNGDIYVAGKKDGRACYWKNGSIVYVGDRVQSSAAYAICISGSDVYVAGYSTAYNVNELSKQKPVYWKNGIQINLPIDGSADALRASAIAANGTDVYVVGIGLFDGSPYSFIKASYWKNGLFKDISQTNDAKISYSANGVAVNGSDIYVSVSASYKSYLLKNDVQIALNTNGATSNYNYTGICLVPK